MVKNKKRHANKNHQQSQQCTDGHHGTKFFQKKRPRSTSDASGSEGTKTTANQTKQSKDAARVDITSHVIQWLESRKKSVPSELKREDSPSDMEQILPLLPGLRERERRALVRRIEKVLKNGGTDGAEQKQELEGSDNEYDGSNDDMQKLSNKNQEWPPSVEFSNNYRWERSVPIEIKNKYCPPTGTRDRANHFSRKVYFKKITDSNHPAFGEFGLYCALPGGAPPGTWLLDYVGHITLGEDQNKQSDYVSDFGEKSELACDANTYGNEARFLNDFRNTGRHPNVEFNFRRDRHGELRQGVYVKLEKDSKVEGFSGVQQHEELLVSYGKSYWRSRHGNLTDFVWRLPGQEMSTSKNVVARAVHQ